MVATIVVVANVPSPGMVGDFNTRWDISDG